MTNGSRVPESATTRINIALIPPPVVAEAVAGYARSLILEDSLFIVDCVERHAHMTLYMSEFSQQNSSGVEILERVNSVLRDQEPVLCSTASVSVVDGGYVELSYEKTAALVELQSQIVGAVESLAEQTALPSHTTKTPARIASLRCHKYEYTGDSFRPHITLGRALRAVMLPVKSVARLPDFSFTGSTLVIGSADDQGSIRRILHSVNIEGNSVSL